MLLKILKEFFEGILLLKSHLSRSIFRFTTNMWKNCSAPGSLSQNYTCTLANPEKSHAHEKVTPRVVKEVFAGFVRRVGGGHWWSSDIVGRGQQDSSDHVCSQATQRIASHACASLCRNHSTGSLVHLFFPSKTPDLSHLSLAILVCFVDMSHQYAT